MSNDAVLLCSIASPGIFSLFPHPRGSANIFYLNLFGRESKTLFWLHAETAENRSSMRQIVIKQFY